MPDLRDSDSTLFSTERGNYEAHDFVNLIQKARNSYASYKDRFNNIDKDDNMQDDSKIVKVGATTPGSKEPTTTRDVEHPTPTPTPDPIPTKEPIRDKTLMVLEENVKRSQMEYQNAVNAFQTFKVDVSEGKYQYTRDMEQKLYDNVQTELNGLLKDKKALEDYKSGDFTETTIDPAKISNVSTSDLSNPRDVQPVPSNTAKDPFIFYAP